MKFAHTPSPPPPRLSYLYYVLARLTIFKCVKMTRIYSS